MSKLPLYVFKVIIIGEPAVGKTSLVKQYVTDQFSQEYKSTMGANIYLKTVEMEDGTKVKFTLWDIAGQRERFAQMQNIYFQGAQGCIIVYDMSRKVTFTKIEEAWVPSLGKFMTEPNYQKILIANKVDLPDKEVSPEEGEQLRVKLGCNSFLQTSAKENIAVDESFTTLAKLLISNFQDK